MSYANDNTAETYWVLFFDSSADDAMSSSMEGPFLTIDAAIEYSAAAYETAKSFGIPWRPTEIVRDSDLD